MRVGAEKVLLLPINDAACKWHRTAERLAGMEITGDRGLLRKLDELEYELDELWTRRRHHLARSFACSRQIEEAVLNGEQFTKLEFLHVGPVC